MSRLIKPTRRALIIGGASLIAAPHVARAGSLTLLGAGSFSTPAPWTPASLPNPLFWYEFAAANMTLDTGVIVSVADLSGNGHTLSDFNYPAAGVPYNAASGYNSKPAADFNGGTANLLYANSVPLIGGDFSVFVVGQMTSTGPGYAGAVVYAVSGDDYATNGNSALLHRNSTNAILATQDGETGLTTTGMTTDANHIFGVVYSSSGPSVTQYIDNVAGTPTAAGITFVTGGTLVVGGRYLSGAPNSGNTWKGPICAVVGWRGSASADRNSLYAYLSGKYGT